MDEAPDEAHQQPVVFDLANIAAGGEFWRRTNNKDRRLSVVACGSPEIGGAIGGIYSDCGLIRLRKSDRGQPLRSARTTPSGNHDQLRLDRFVSAAAHTANASAAVFEPANGHTGFEGYIRQA